LENASAALDCASAGPDPASPAGSWTVLTNPLLETNTGEVDFAPFALLWE
jgi:hypothetical protein